MTERDHRARMLQRARRHRRMARDAFNASSQSISQRGSLLVMAQEWYTLALQIENMLPEHQNAPVTGRGMLAVLSF